MIPYRSRPPQSQGSLSAKGRRKSPYRSTSFFRYTNQYAMPTATPPATLPSVAADRFVAMPASVTASGAPTPIELSNQPHGEEEHVRHAVLEPARNERRDGQQDAEHLVGDGARREPDPHGQAHEDSCT